MGSQRPDHIKKVPRFHFLQQGGPFSHNVENDAHRGSLYPVNTEWPSEERVRKFPPPDIDKLARLCAPRYLPTLKGKDEQIITHFHDLADRTALLNQ
jgi:hypothetical protein